MANMTLETAHLIEMQHARIFLKFQKIVIFIVDTCQSVIFLLSSMLGESTGDEI